mmetsp:Transcript_19427/g.65644  ORF Transcript_19427/g.65644 Transcript_19427/m.65644 type:complete len:296 (-) Transcript_19427:1836-2723(-)
MRAEESSAAAAARAGDGQQSRSDLPLASWSVAAPTRRSHAGVALATANGGAAEKSTRASFEASQSENAADAGLISCGAPSYALASKTADAAVSSTCTPSTCTASTTAVDDTDEDRGRSERLRSRSMASRRCITFSSAAAWSRFGCECLTTRSTSVMSCASEPRSSTSSNSSEVSIKNAFMLARTSGMLAKRSWKSSVGMMCSSTTAECAWHEKLYVRCRPRSTSSPKESVQLRCVLASWPSRRCVCWTMPALTMNMAWPVSPTRTMSSSATATAKEMTEARRARDPKGSISKSGL